MVLRLGQETSSRRDEILRCYPNFRLSGVAAAGTLVTTEEAHRIVDGSLGEQKKLYEALVAQLNYLEGLSTAYQNGVADEKMFEASFKGIITGWYGRLHLFIPVVKKKCECSWEPFEQLAKKWWGGSPLPSGAGIQSTCLVSKK